MTTAGISACPAALALLAVANCMSAQLPKTVSASTDNCDISTDFPHRVKSFRERSGFTQKQLGDLLRRTSGYISSLERGAETPGRDLVEKFEALERSPAYNHPDFSRTGISGVSAGPMPSHSMPDFAQRAVTPALGQKKSSSQIEEFTTCVAMLADILEADPVAFGVASAMIKGLHQAIPK